MQVVLGLLMQSGVSVGTELLLGWIVLMYEKKLQKFFKNVF